MSSHAHRTHHNVVGWLDDSIKYVFSIALAFTRLILIIPIVTTQLHSPVALVQPVTYVIDRIQKEKVLRVAFLLFACSIPGISSLMSQLKRQKRCFFFFQGSLLGLFCCYARFARYDCLNRQSCCRQRLIYMYYLYYILH
jgi:hypothetical protein